ncbi:MAG TPA: hypothetical protein VMS92_12225 [Mycobacterium sp.]|nr:hypothetical protein [Mycobacterium sp.]
MHITASGRHGLPLPVILEFLLAGTTVFGDLVAESATMTAIIWTPRP